MKFAPKHPDDPDAIIDFATFEWKVQLQAFNASIKDIWDEQCAIEITDTDYETKHATILK